jgi:hypothetical protein
MRPSPVQSRKTGLVKVSSRSEPICHPVTEAIVPSSAMARWWTSVLR